MKQTRRFRTRGRLSKKEWTIRKSRMFFSSIILSDHKKYKRYMLKQHKTYACYLRRKNRYNPMMEEVKELISKMPDYHPDYSHLLKREEDK